MLGEDFGYSYNYLVERRLLPAVGLETITDIALIFQPVWAFFFWLHSLLAPFSFPFETAKLLHTLSVYSFGSFYICSCDPPWLACHQADNYFVVMPPIATQLLRWDNHHTEARVVQVTRGDP